MSISYKFTKFEVKEIKKRSERNNIPFWAQPTSKLEFHSTELQKIKEETMEKSLGLGKKSYGTETDTETQSWFQLPIPKPGFGRTLRQGRAYSATLPSAFRYRRQGYKIMPCPSGDFFCHSKET
jgi:hypothetical protein